MCNIHSTHYLNESLSTRLAANVVSLGNTPEGEELHQQRKVAVQQRSLHRALASGAGKCVLLPVNTTISTGQYDTQ